MRILLTGGVGFVGSNLTPALLRNPLVSELTILDSLRPTANPERLRCFQSSPKFDFVYGDIRDQELVNNLVQNTDVVINLAGETHVDKSIADSQLFFEVNVLGTHNLLQASLRHGRTRFIHISTDEVWGHSVNGTIFNELSPYAPRNPYAASKASADHLVRSYGITHGLPFNIIHFTNLYGPWQYPDKLIPRSILRLMDEEKIQIHGDGKNMRMWLHVEDSVKGVIDVFERGVPGESYALGSHDEKENIEVAQLLLEMFSRPGSEVEFVADRPGNDLRYCVSYDKIHTDLGWEPRVDFQDGLKDEVDWFKRHGDWIGRRR